MFFGASSMNSDLPWDVTAGELFEAMFSGEPFSIPIVTIHTMDMPSTQPSFVSFRCCFIQQAIALEYQLCT